MMSLYERSREITARTQMLSMMKSHLQELYKQYNSSFYGFVRDNNKIEKPKIKWLIENLEKQIEKEEESIKKLKQY